MEDRRRQMIKAVRSGLSVRAVAEVFGVSAGAVAYWVKQTRGKRLDRAPLDNRKPGRAWNRTPPDLEARIVDVRRMLREDSPVDSSIGG